MHRIPVAPLTSFGYRLPIMLLATALLCAAPGVAEARRTVIDGNQWGSTYEISTDVEDGFGIQLPFDVDYGSGLQSDLIVNLGTCCLPPDGGPPAVPVGLTFTNSPGDSLFASVLVEQFIDSAVRTSNDQEASTPLDPVEQASMFDFGMAFLITGGPPAIPTEETGNLGFYSPFFGSASFEFTDLSGSGAPGDFGLDLLCNGICTNIGFSLGGLDFSSDLFDPANAPSQLISFNIGEGTSSFSFVFRNAAPAVPEPGTWALMLLGFGAVGMAIRRDRGKPALHPL